MHLSAEPVLTAPAQSEKVGVVRANGQYCLVACKTILRDESIFQIIGEYTTRPSRYSVQVGKQLHVDVAAGIDSEVILDNFFWRFMNHGCEPTAYIRECAVIALRDIAPWEEITFNYNTVEYDLAEPFVCCCNSPSCMGRIRGYKYLGLEERRRLLPFTAPHLI
jgi:hypothetical protein